jgi:hypothetical protein
VLQTRGFKHGSALVVCTTAAAASIVAGGAFTSVGLLVGLVEFNNGGRVGAADARLQARFGAGGVHYCRGS